MAHTGSSLTLQSANPSRFTVAGVAGPVIAPVGGPLRPAGSRSVGSLMCFHGQFGLSQHPAGFPSFFMISFSRQQVWSPDLFIAYRAPPGPVVRDETGRPPSGLGPRAPAWPGRRCPF